MRVGIGSELAQSIAAIEARSAEGASQPPAATRDALGAVAAAQADSARTGFRGALKRAP